MRKKIRDIYELGGSPSGKALLLAEVRGAISATLIKNESRCLDSEEDRTALLNDLMETLKLCGYTTTHIKNDSP